MRYTCNSSTVVSLPNVNPGSSTSEGNPFIVDVQVLPPPGGLTSALTVTLSIQDGTTGKTTLNMMLLSTSS